MMNYHCGQEADNELPSPIISEMVSTIPYGIVRHVHIATTPLGKPFGILENVVWCACGAWELTPCIFYALQVLGFLDSWCNSIYTVFNVPIKLLYHEQLFA